MVRELALPNEVMVRFRLGVITRSRGATEIARKAGVSRDAIYKALSKDGNPNLSTLLKVMDAMGVKLSVKVG